MSQKHYHNDYKKLMGVDETRTASEKLLDKAFAKRDTPLTVQKVQQSEPKKRVKQEQPQQPPEVKPAEVAVKIIKALKNCTGNAMKTEKAYNILLKCLEDGQFTGNLQEGQVTEICDCITGHDKYPSDKLNQMIKISQVELQIIGCLNRAIEDKFAQLSPLQQQLRICECLGRLVTDDSFQFAKHLNAFKMCLFEFFGAELQNQPKTERMKSYIQQTILKKIFRLPNLHLEWARTGLIATIKQFVNAHKEELSSPKQFLTQYNKLLQAKKPAAGGASYDIMGSAHTSGGQYTVVETQDAADSWCRRQ